MPPVPVRHRRSRASPASRDATRPAIAAHWRYRRRQSQQRVFRASAGKPRRTQHGQGGASITPGGISRLRPNPLLLRMVKPASCNPRRTKPAEVNVASVAPGRASLAIALNRPCVHMSGFFAGAKPSRNQASTCCCSESSKVSVSSLISPNQTSSVTRPPSSNRRWHPAKGSGHCCCNCSAQGASSGQCWCARRRSSFVKGNFSKLMYKIPSSVTDRNPNRQQCSHTYLGLLLNRLANCLPSNPSR